MVDDPDSPLNVFPYSPGGVPWTGNFFSPLFPSGKPLEPPTTHTPLSLFVHGDRATVPFVYSITPFLQTRRQHSCRFHHSSIHDKTCTRFVFIPSLLSFLFSFQSGLRRAQLTWCYLYISPPPKLALLILIAANPPSIVSVSLPPRRRWSCLPPILSLLLAELSAVCPSVLFPEECWNRRRLFFFWCSSPYLAGQISSRSLSLPL